MDRINSSNVAIINGRKGWRNKNLGAGLAGTTLDAAWMDDLQEELINILLSRAVTPVAGTQNQIVAALAQLPSGTTRPSFLTAKSQWLLVPATGTTWTWYFYTGTADIAIGTFNTSTNLFSFSGAGTGPSCTVVSASQTLTSTVFSGIVATIGSSAITLTLPTPVGNGGAQIELIMGGTGALTLSTPSGVFNGATGNGTNSVTLVAGLSSSVFLTSDGTNWFVTATPRLSSSGDLSVISLNTRAIGGLSAYSILTLDGNSRAPAVDNYFGAVTSTGVSDWNDVTNTKPGTSPILLMGNTTNGPGPAYYYHVLNFEYATKSGLGNVTQLAIAYGSPGNDIWMRGRYSAVWTAWVQLLNSGNVATFASRLIRSPQILLSGTSYTTPTNCSKILIEMIGAGGGGGGASYAGGNSFGGGGGGSVYAEAFVAVSPSTAYSMQIGAGGVGGSGAGVAGGTGGDTSITINGVTYKITGGTGGAGATSGSGQAAAGSTGVATNFDLSLSPSVPVSTIYGGCVDTPYGVAKGGNVMRDMSGNSPTQVLAGQSGLGFGAGGGGGWCYGYTGGSSVGGGSGIKGMIRIWEFQ